MYYSICFHVANIVSYLTGRIFLTEFIYCYSYLLDLKATNILFICPCKKTFVTHWVEHVLYFFSWHVGFHKHIILVFSTKFFLFLILGLHYKSSVICGPCQWIKYGEKIRLHSSLAKEHIVCVYSLGR